MQLPSNSASYANQQTKDTDARRANTARRADESLGHLWPRVECGNLKADVSHALCWKWTAWRQELSSITIKSRKDILSSLPCSAEGINLHLLAQDKGQRLPIAAGNLTPSENHF